MKRLLTLSLMLGAMAFVVPSIEAKTPAPNTAVTAPQIRVRIGPRRNRRTRIVTRTRIRHIGRYTYRETIRTTHFANGRTRTRVISRVRIGRRG